MRTEYSSYADWEEDFAGNGVSVAFPPHWSSQKREAFCLSWRRIVGLLPLDSPPNRSNPDVEMQSFSSQQPRLLSLLAIAAILACGAAYAAPGEAASASPWTASTNSKVRLVAGRAAEEAGPRGSSGIKFRRRPAGKTYGRNPGASGLPPKLNWTESKNLKSAEVPNPAPGRSTMAGASRSVTAAMCC